MCFLWRSCPCWWLFKTPPPTFLSFFFFCNDPACLLRCEPFSALCKGYHLSLPFGCSWRSGLLQVSLPGLNAIGSQSFFHPKRIWTPRNVWTWSTSKPSPACTIKLVPCSWPCKYGNKGTFGKTLIACRPHSGARRVRHHGGWLGGTMRCSSVAVAFLWV